MALSLLPMLLHSDSAHPILAHAAESQFVERCNA